MAALCTLLALLLHHGIVKSAAASPERVLMSSVQTLVFSKGDMTHSRTGNPISKLMCIGGDCLRGGSGMGELSQALCTNQGADDMGRVAWRCTASMPKGCKFRKTTVSCEGYSGKDDEFIVPGSCALMYSTTCDRAAEAQKEESQERRRVQEERERQQELALAEAERIRGQAARDACELAVAGALYPVGQDVEVLRAQRGAGEQVWTRGSVGHIACDGTYRIDFWSSNPPMASMSGVRESDLRVAVKPIYLEEYVSASTASAFRNQPPPGGRSERPFPQSEYNSSTDRIGIVSSVFVVVLVCVIVLLFWCCGAFEYHLTEESVVKCLYNSPGHRLKLYAIRAQLRAYIEAENSRARNGDEKLRQFLSNVAIEEYTDDAGFPPPHVPQADDVFFRLKPRLVAREQEREKKMQRERELQREREQQRERERRLKEMYSRQTKMEDHMRNKTTTTERERTAHFTHEGLRQRPQRQSQVGGGIERKLDEQAMEQRREIETKMLAARARLRVDQVKAKQNRKEAARIQEYDTRIEQMQRDIENDTSQLGNAMQRLTQLMEEYEAIGMASTKVR